MNQTLATWTGIAGFWALAMAWHMYQNIASGPEALTTLRSRRLDLVLVIALVSLLVPTIVALVEANIRRLASDQAAALFTRLPSVRRSPCSLGSSWL